MGADTPEMLPWNTFDSQREVYSDAAPAPTTTAPPPQAA